VQNVLLLLHCLLTDACSCPSRDFSHKSEFVGELCRAGLVHFRLPSTSVHSGKHKTQIL
jgi:hypothetical protein